MTRRTFRGLHANRLNADVRWRLLLLLLAWRTLACLVRAQHRVLPRIAHDRVTCAISPLSVADQHVGSVIKENAVTVPRRAPIKLADPLANLAMVPIADTCTVRVVQHRYSFARSVECCSWRR